MQNYQFIGQAPRFYPDIAGPDGSLIAIPGDVAEFEEPPSDGLWVETDAAATDMSGRSWPIRPATGGLITQEAAAIVGEHGPEIVDLDAGSVIIPLTPPEEID